MLKVSAKLSKLFSILLRPHFFLFLVSAFLVTKIEGFFQKIHFLPIVRYAINKVYLSFHHYTFVTFVFFRLHFLCSTLFTLFGFILLIYIDRGREIIKGEETFERLRERMWLEIWLKTIGWQHRSLPADSTSINFWPYVFNQYRVLRHCYLALLLFCNKLAAQTKEW